MAPSYEMAASILLCAEDSSSIFGFSDGEEVEAAAGAMAGGSPYCGGGGELAVEFPLPSEECVARWVATEVEHMPRKDYAERLRAGGVDLRVRTDSIDWIWKCLMINHRCPTGSHVLRLRPCHCVLGPQLHGPLPLALPDTGGQGLDDAAAIGGVLVSCCQDG
ncbi:unnamed protein product [Triticum turgidum subsp. durum]|uniref:Uncharacterized protein n=1 Tax=Triticum turgidum subsp. durum TaxID=4567 RepID=A0A9R0XAV2_TRITD|nr:unnamed protein product [Triticum turgidum subsp. durum]